jgi:hypothetical protein
VGEVEDFVPVKKMARPITHYRSSSWSTFVVRSTATWLELSK